MWLAVRSSIGTPASRIARDRREPARVRIPSASNSWHHLWNESSPSRPAAAARTASTALSPLARGPFRSAAGIAGERVRFRAAAFARRLARTLGRLRRTLPARFLARGPVLRRGLRLTALLVARRLRLGAGGAILRRRLGLVALSLRRVRPVLIPALGALGPLLLCVLRPITTLFIHVFAMVLPVVSCVLAIVVVVVPGIVVHVAAAVHAM